MGLFTKEIKNMEALFVHVLQDIYCAENQALKALPASSPTLVRAFFLFAMVSPLPAE